MCLPRVEIQQHGAKAVARTLWARFARITSQEVETDFLAHTASLLDVALYEAKRVTPGGAHASSSTLYLGMHRPPSTGCTARCEKKKYWGSILSRKVERFSPLTPYADLIDLRMAYAILVDPPPGRQPLGIKDPLAQAPGAHVPAGVALLRLTLDTPCGSPGTVRPGSTRLPRTLPSADSPG